MKNKALKFTFFVIILVGAYFLSSISFGRQEIGPSKNIELKNTLKPKKDLDFKNKKRTPLKNKIKEKSKEIKKHFSFNDHQRNQAIEEFIDGSGTIQIFEGVRNNLNNFIENLPNEEGNEKQKRIRLKLVTLTNQLLDSKGFVEELKKEFKNGKFDHILSEVNELYKRPVMEKMVSEIELKLSSPDFLTQVQKLGDDRNELSEQRIQLYKDLEKSDTENYAERNHLMETFQKDLSLSIVQIFVSEMPADKRPSIEALKKSIGQEFEKNRVNNEKKAINISHYLYGNLNDEEIKEIIKIYNNESMKKLNDVSLKKFIENLKRKSS